MIPIYVSPLGYALSCLAAQCDGARTDDRAGFSAAHAHQGGLLARIPFAEWTPSDEAWVASILPIYRSQLAEMGVNVDDLDLECAPVWVQTHSRACILWDTEVELYQVVLPSKTHAKARTAVRRLEGVTLHTKPFRHLRVPAQHAAALAFLAQEEAVETIGEVTTRLAAVTPRDLRARDRSVTLEAEQFRLRFPRSDRTLLNRVRAMPQHLRRFDVDDPSWGVPRTPAGAQALQKLREDIDVTIADHDREVLTALAAQSADDPSSGDYQVVLDRGRVLFVFPYREDLIDLMRTAKNDHNDQMRLQRKHDFAFFTPDTPYGTAWSWPICTRLRQLIIDLQAATQGAFVVDDALMPLLNQNAA